MPTNQHQESNNPIKKLGQRLKKDTHFLEDDIRVVKKPQ